jgi:hypothetical protein
VTRWRDQFPTRLLQGLSAAGMELCWLYAAVVFFYRINDLPLFPATGAVVLFAAAIAPGTIVRGRGWAVYQVGLLYLAFALPALLVAIHAFGRWTGLEQPLTDPAWIRTFLNAAVGGDWIVVVLVLVSGGMFWWSGIGLFRRSRSGDSVTRRFDLGVGILSAVVLLDAAVRFSFPELIPLMISFFLFAAVAISTARAGGSGSRYFAAGHRGIGIAFSLAPALIILGLALLPLLPLFKQAALAGYTVVRAIAGWLKPLIVAILRFLFGHYSRQPVDQPPAVQTAREIQQYEPSVLIPPLLAFILKWVAIVVFASVLAFFVGFTLWRLFLFLTSRTPGGRPPRERSLGIHLLRWLRQMASALARVLASLFRRLRRGSLRRPSAQQAFAKLTRWGARSGVFRRVGETPLEYGRRLGSRFLELDAAINAIVYSFNESFYGRRPTQAGSALGRSCRILGAPRFWPVRLRSRLNPD